MVTLLLRFRNTLTNQLTKLQRFHGPWFTDDVFARMTRNEHTASDTADNA